MKRKNGFTLVEILISTAIMAIAIGGTFQVLSSLIRMNETNENLTMANNFAQGITNEIRNVEFENISNSYNNDTFTCPELTAKGIPNMGLITVTDIVPGFLIRVRVTICWRDRNRVMGEDVNLNGILEASEDLNNNKEIDSPCLIETAIAEKHV